MSSNAVVSPHHLSAEAGRTILRQGGNAVDAALAVVAAQGVVAPETCGLGGDLFALVHRPGWTTPKTLNSSGRAGSNLDANEIRSDHGAVIPLDHPAAVTTPGCVDGLETLSEALGTLPLATVLQPAIELAAEGFEVSTEQAAAFANNATIYVDNPAVADFFVGGAPLARGETVRRPNLASTLLAIADGGRAAFYEGIPGEDIVDATGGMITPADLATSLAEWVAPISSDIAGVTCWTIPPNTQGYLTPGSLAIFESLSPPADHEDPLWWHLLIESYRCLAWELTDIVADPEFAPLPDDLMLDSDRLRRAADTVSRESTGTWPDMGRRTDTAYMCVVDASGLSVSIIQSNYRGLGSPHGAARSGFLLQDRGLGFTLTPGHPNEAAAGKRPLHTLAPTLWTEGSEPRWTLGTRGGHMQPQLLIQVAARAILGDMDPGQAQSAPRWTMDQYGPDTRSTLEVEPETPGHIVARLRDLGHQIQVNPTRSGGWGPVSMIGISGSERVAAADPRVDTATALLF